MAGFPLARETSCVFVLFSIHDVMKAEAMLKERGALFDTVPVPKEVSSDCGMALLVKMREKETVLRLLTDQGIKIKGIYRKRDTGYERIGDE